MHNYITDNEFIEAQDAYNNEENEDKAKKILQDVFWPYLKNLAFCTVRKILTQRGVISYYDTEELDDIATDVVSSLVNRYVEAKHHKGRCWNKYHKHYRKNLPKTMVYYCAILKISEYKKTETLPIYSSAGSYDTFEDDIIEKLSREGY